MTVVPRLGIEPGTAGFEIPHANHSTTADSNAWTSENVCMWVRIKPIEIDLSELKHVI